MISPNKYQYFPKKGHKESQEIVTGPYQLSYLIPFLVSQDVADTGAARVN